MKLLIEPQLRDKAIVAWSAFAALMIALAIIGGYRNYSPVPYWDMWDGVLNFYIQIENGNYSAWWAQHNEHRIVLARLLFWIDYRYFGGLSVFLIFFNYLLVSFAAYIFWRYIRESSGTKNAAKSEIILALFITGGLFSWAQDVNLTWGFQSQFFMAQTMPLWALLWLARSSRNPTNNFNYIAACLIGVVSAGTMANGVLALPVLFLCAVFLRLSAVKTGLLFTLSLVVISLYFNDYHTPDAHGHFLNAIKDDPLGFLHYVLLYLGNPLYALIGKGEFGKLLGLLAGFMLIVGMAWLLFRQIRCKDKSPEVLALLCFIVYVGGTAFGTASGRLVFGVDQALTSRYVTPSLMAWAAFAVVIYLSDHATTASVQKRITALMLVLGLLLLGKQVNTLKQVDHILSERQIAALALALDVDDKKYISSIYPNSDRALALSRIAAQKNYSIFGEYPYAGLKQQMFKPYATNATNECKGNVDKIELIENVGNYVRIRGWFFDAADQKSPLLVRFVDNKGVVNGFAITGMPNNEATVTVDKKAKLSGFSGYLNASLLGHQITAMGDRPSCRLTVNLPDSL